MSNTSHVSKARRTLLRSRLAAVGLGASLLLGAGAMTASAADVTEPVNWRTNSGSTPSGVTWTGQGGAPNSPVGRVMQGSTRTLTFSEPVTATFDVHNLNGWDGASRECVRLSPGVVLVRLDTDNTWNPTTRQLCYRGPQGTSADGSNADTVSSFRTTEPITQLAMTGVSGGNRQSIISDLYVTSDDTPPVPMVAPAFAAVGLLATGAVAGVRRLRGTRQETSQNVTA